MQRRSRSSPKANGGGPVMLSPWKIIFATVLIAHAVSARAEPNYAPNWDARKCAGLEELMRPLNGYGRLIFLRDLKKLCGRRDLNDEIEKLTEEFDFPIQFATPGPPTPKPPKPRGPVFCTTDFGRGLAITTCIEP
jgi:hypothetical protein